MDDDQATPREKRWAPPEPLGPEPERAADPRPREHGSRDGEATGRFRAPAPDSGAVTRTDLFIMFFVLCAVILTAAWAIRG